VGSDGLVKSSVVKNSDGKPLARGKYQIVLVESATQTPQVQALMGGFAPSAEKLPEGIPAGKRMVFNQIMFLGGLEDQGYAERLKVYHDKLKERAKAELEELKMYSSTLETEAGNSIKTFSRFGKGNPGPKAKKDWAVFHDRWMKFADQREQAFKNWTPESLQTEFFYGKIFDLAKDAGRAASEMHLLHHSYFIDHIDQKMFQDKVKDLTDRTQNLLKQLREKIDAAEHLEPTPTGMPRREGL